MIENDKIINSININNLVDNQLINESVNNIDTRKFNFDVTNAEFNILGEEVKSIDKIGKNQVSIISTNNKSAVVGYYCIIDGNMYSVGNAYHTEYLDKTKFSKM